MTATHHEFDGLRSLLDHGKANRRDALRVSAIAAAAAAMPLRGIYAQDTTPGTPAAQQIEGGYRLTLPFNPYGEGLSLDPHRTVNWGPYWVLLPYAWSGLLRFDENGAVEPDLAEELVPNDDGSVWTAKLRSEIKFANGDAITAEDVVTSWKRALDPTQLSPMAHFFFPIQGAEEIASGENAVLGVNAIDDQTIEISLTEPLAHFPSYLATFVYAVVHPKVNGGNDDALSLHEGTSGPWKLADVTDDQILMTPNENYWDAQPADITELVWRIAPGGNTDYVILDWYQNNEIAIADIPQSVLPSVQDLGTLTAELKQNDSQAATLALALDFHQAPFNDVRVRRAVAAAVNRETWAKEIQQSTYVAANSFSPPALSTIAGYEPPTDAFDDDIQKLLADAKYEPESAEDEVLLFQPATDSPDAIARVGALAAMIQEATGIAIHHDTALTAEQITAARQDQGGLHMALMQWQLDSDHPSLLAIASQESAFNSGWFNWEPNLEPSGDYTPGDDATAFDELVTKAQAAMSAEERNALYADAEALLLKNAVLIPLGYWNPMYVQKPWLEGTRQGPWSGSTPVRIDSAVTINKEALESQ